MIDFILGLVFGGLAVLAFFHFKGPTALKATPNLDLETIFEGVRNLMSQAADDLAAKISALPAEFEAKFNAQIADIQGQLDAEKADHAADIAKLSDAVNAVAQAQPTA
jgi:hypothetical protein